MSSVNSCRTALAVLFQQVFPHPAWNILLASRVFLCDTGMSFGRSAKSNKYEGSLGLTVLYAQICRPWISQISSTWENAIRSCNSCFCASSCAYLTALQVVQTAKTSLLHSGSREEFPTLTFSNMTCQTFDMSLGMPDALSPAPDATSSFCSSRAPVSGAAQCPIPHPAPTSKKLSSVSSATPAPSCSHGTAPAAPAQAVQAGSPGVHQPWWGRCLCPQHPTSRCGLASPTVC